MNARRCEWRNHFGHRCSPEVRLVNVSRRRRLSAHQLCQNAIRETEARGFQVRNVNHIEKAFEK